MKKRILSLILVCAMMVGVISAMSLSVSAEVWNPLQNAIAAEASSITVDGEIDDAWSQAPLNTLTVDAFQDSRGDEATRGESSKVEFRVMYDENKVYLLFEIYDDTWISGTGAKDWQNDSIFLCITEDPYGGNGSWGETAYILCAYPDTAEGKTATELLFARNGKNTGSKEIVVKEVDETHRTVEFSFEFNTRTPAFGDFFFLDIQYNDADRDCNGTTNDQNRTIVWNWSTNNSSGNSAGNARSNWGRVGFGVDPTTNILPNKKANAYEVDSLTVDGVIDEAWSEAEVQTLDIVASMDSVGEEATRKQSSTVKFRTMYSGNKVYMLFEIYDDVWANGVRTKDYENDSLFICVSESREVLMKSSSDVPYCQFQNAAYNSSGYAYVFNAFPDTLAGITTGDTISSYFKERKGTGGDTEAREYAVKEVDENNRIVELSFALKNTDLDSIYLDVQYNDCDSQDYSTKRTVVWNWSSLSKRPSDQAVLSAGNAGRDWGRIDFVDSKTLTHHDGKANGASFYYQANADKTSYRIVGLIDEASVNSIEGIKITFSNGEIEKSVTLTSAKAYSSIDASFGGVTITYVAEEGTVIVGWVITGIDEEGYAPSAVAVINS